MERITPTGFDDLTLTTRLLQQSRLADPLGGDWEAADFQWAWRVDQHADPARQVVWTDGGEPVGEILIQAWRGDLEFFVLRHPERGPSYDEMLGASLVMLSTVSERVDLAVGTADPELAQLAAAAGFREGTKTYVTCWRSTRELPRGALPSGFGIRSRADRPDAPHPMVSRNGPDVAARLAEAALYRADLDLEAVALDGTTAGYALLWLDPVTGVGVLEPMRTEPAYQNKGIGSALVAEGMRRLVAAGATRLKVIHEEDNEAAGRLYRGQGYGPTNTVRTWTRHP